MIRISPQAPVLPANILRFYLYRRRPWEAHFDRDRLRLEDEDGRVISDPFLVLSQELWSADGRRLTVLMEPGRLKRGMGADPSHQPALVIGRTYSLVVEAMGETSRHAFLVGEAISRALDETRWRIEPPRVGSLEPLTLRFDRVMDAALCEDEIAVLDPCGEVLPTHALLAADERLAYLAPSRPWSAGVHRLLFSARLEDVCGNRLGEALDHDLDEPGRPHGAAIVFSPADGSFGAPTRPRADGGMETPI